MRLFHLPMKKLPGITTILLVAIALSFAVTGCTPNAGNNIVGKWAQGTNTTVTFTKDGAMSTTEDGRTKGGKYYVTNGNTLSITMDVMPLTIMFTMEFPSDKELVLSMQMPTNAPPGANEKPQHFTRVSN